MSNTPASGSAGKRDQNAKKPTQLPMKAWKDIAVRVYHQLIEDHVSIVSAGTAFYFFLPFFPLWQPLFPYMGW